jgi:Family of unknown function (DUF6788)
VHPAASRQAEADKIAAEIAGIARTGMVLPGSITQRRTRCGRANCGCHADPPRLHGPYWQWTRKIAAKTICRWLSPDQHDDYQPWIDNDRRLHELLARLEALGIAAFEADPRWQQRRRTSPAAPADRPAEPEPAAPDNVGTTRLTCGRPSTQPSYPQLRAKREDLTKFKSCRAHRPRSANLRGRAHAVVAQQVRASPCQGGGRRFEAGQPLARRSSPTGRGARSRAGRFAVRIRGTARG